MISRYEGISPRSDIVLIERLCEKLRGKTFLHVNSTKAGGGVAEILQRMVPLLGDLGIKARWEVITGDEKFFDMTKKVHNALQGDAEAISDGMWDHYREVNRGNAARLDLDADAVLIHDPQPAPLVEYRKGGKWFWRCHIDISSPKREVYTKIDPYVREYDLAIFSVAKFARAAAVEEFIVSPSIDPLSEKNMDLDGDEIKEIARKFDIPLDRPIILQVSRFDRWKDPQGVIEAFKLARKEVDATLVLLGNVATDDPEGAAVYHSLLDEREERIIILSVQDTALVNALQRRAHVVLQKSIREGFGLTVAEAMWKGTPVIGGNAGGIRCQIEDGVNGFLVSSVQEAAERVVQLIGDEDLRRRIGQKGRETVKERFLLSRHAEEYLDIFASFDANFRLLKDRVSRYC
ncbi:MAG: glycosyltransferase [Nitrospirota bacterium]